MPKTAIIIGAGPAGLTAAYELLHRTDIQPIILEKSGDIGGISKTVEYKGNRMDMGPHRFFSKSDRVMNWWLNLFPLDTTANQEAVTIQYQNRHRSVTTTDAGGEHAAGRDPDKVMLVIQRLTRIYFLRKFFAYPIQLSLDTLQTLGLARTVKIIISYLYARIRPRRPVTSLEDFIINQFGRQLYLLFFKDYTEKVWGVPCGQISAEWGAQRIKGVSLSKAISHAIRTFPKSKGAGSPIRQKEIETSLVDQFLYPKRGPGQLWEEVARQVQALGGKIYLNQEVQKITQVTENITDVTTINQLTGRIATWEGDYFFSTMPVQELIGDMSGQVPAGVKEVAAGLQYRDFINVGILLRQLSAPGKDGTAQRLDLKDNWIYIQERDVKVGRLMIYNNWGTGMVKDPDTVWIGMEYFCNKTDAFWALSDEAIQQTGIEELIKMGLAQADDVLDSTVARMEKTYPAYFGTYDRFEDIREYLDRFANLFLIGRNGMHKYNNADHSMLTAMVAVDNILAGVASKENLWSINTEQDYHEEKQAAPEAATPSAPATTVPGVPQQAEPSFQDFIFRQHRPVLFFSAAVLLLQFLVFKWLYPFANFMFDSHVYLDSASRNVDINIWPVGYSKFLRIFSAISHSDTALVFFQFLLLESAALFLYFTLLYFINPGKASRQVILAFILINPAFLSISNYILSDGLFTALSLVWFAQLLWLLYRPSPRLLYSHAILLFLLFTIRHNALYYPLITAAVILFSRLRWSAKIAGLGVAVLLIGAYIQHDRNEYQELTGQKQFSAFGGWQLASNALLMYRNLSYNPADPVPPQFARLNMLTVHELDSFKTCAARPDSAVQIYYIWMESSPLRRYLAQEGAKHPATPYFAQWASLGPLYGAYGLYLIKNHPLAYARYYLWSNVKWFAQPPVEFLGTYNLKKDTVGPLEQAWFKYKTNQVHAVSKNILAINKIYPVLAVVVNLMFICSLLGFSLFNGFNQVSERFRKAALLMTAWWLMNFLFSVLAAPVMLRYQLFSLVLSVSFCSMFIEFIYQLDRAPVAAIKPTGYPKDNLQPA